MEALTVYKSRGDYEGVTIHATKSDDLIAVVLEYSRDGEVSVAGGVCRCSTRVNCPLAKPCGACISQALGALIETAVLGQKNRTPELKEAWQYWLTAFSEEDFSDWRSV